MAKNLNALTLRKLNVKMGYEKNRINREYGNQFFDFMGHQLKSKAEYLFAQWLEKTDTIETWDYEPVTFRLHDAGDDHQTVYVPDFWALHTDGDIVWYEVKEHVTEYDLKKWRLFADSGMDLVVVFQGKCDTSVNKRGRMERSRYTVWEYAGRDYRKEDIK